MVCDDFHHLYIGTSPICQGREDFDCQITHTLIEPLPTQNQSHNQTTTTTLFYGL